IIKPGVPVVTAAQKPEALAKLKEIAVERESPISIIGQNWQFEGGERRAGSGEQQLLITQSPSSFIPHPSSFSLALAGAHQLENGTVAVAALTAVHAHFPLLTIDAIREGLTAVRWPGRLQMVHHAEETPDILVDCAHNQDSAAKLRRALLQEFAWDRLFLVMAATSNKDVIGMMTELLPLAHRTIVTKSSHPRAASPDSLRDTAVSLGYAVDTKPTIADALLHLWQTACPGDLICVTGSIFIVGDLLNQWDGLQSQLINQNPTLNLVSILAGTHDTR
ncbi:MAG: glutamate ligase domain-containing protein, partial [Anaerolineae bacterium]